MISIFLWLLMAIVIIIAFGITFPQNTIQMCRNLRRWLKAHYAQHRGPAAADKIYPPVPWDALLWERHWQPNQPALASQSPSLWDLIRLHGLIPKYLFLTTLLWLCRAGFLELEVEEVRKK